MENESENINKKLSVTVILEGAFIARSEIYDLYMRGDMTPDQFEKEREDINAEAFQRLSKVFNR